MHAVASNLYLKKDRTEWSAPQQSKFSHGKLHFTNKWLLTTVSSKSSPSRFPQEILKQKYLQHSCSMSFMFLASYSHGSSSPTAATYIVVSMVTTYTKPNC